MIWLILVGLIAAYLVISPIGMALALRRTAAILKTSPVQTGTFHTGAPSSPPLRILLTGDSIPAAAGIGSFDESLGGLIANHLTHNHFVTLENRSMVGMRVAGLSDQEISTHWDTVVILVGANDSLHFTSFRAFESSIHEALKHFGEHAKTVVLTGPGEPSVVPAFPFWVRFILRNREAKLRQLMQEAASRFPNVTYLNPHPQLSQVDWHDPKYLSPDKFHPSAAGHLVWFEIIRPELG